MKQTILRSMVILTLIAVIISSAASIFVVYNIHFDYTKDDLQQNAAFVLSLLEETHSLPELANSQAVATANTRITIIGADGSVSFDNEADHEQMGNHNDREEIITAREYGTGEGQRLSGTLGTRTLYYAVLIADGTVIRFAKDIASFTYTLYRMLTLVALVIAGITVIAVWLGEKMADSIITPINNINLDKPLENDVYDELSPLLTKIYRQNRAINDHVEILESQQEQFRAISTNMGEGLILLDDQARILYMNISALNVLAEQTNAIETLLGKNLLVLNRDLKLRKTVQQGLKGDYAETILALDDKCYQVSVNAVLDEEKITGAVVLLLDITQKYEAEQMRKEFSANVSHELKTPLTVISSYAELLKNDMVKPEDITDFAGRIYDETNRMSTLINDILRLSRLDERVEVRPKEEVDLYELSQQVIDRLSPFAEIKSVNLSLSGVSAGVVGDPVVLFELVYNLCENAIKYNREKDGQVSVNCFKEDNLVALQIRDNGIGIPKEHQDRIFERFYRVDKSHSRKTGGTGLGLSIVKHAAAYHDATLKLESVEGVGTTITIKFPPASIEKNTN